MDFQGVFLAASAPAERVFGLDAQTLIGILIQLLNTAILCGGMTYLLYKPVRNFMAKRTERVASQFALAAGEVARAEEMRLQYQQKLDGVDREREEIIDAARKMAEDTSRRLLADASREAEAIRERAANDARMEKERASEEIEREIIEISTIMAAKLIQNAIDREVHDRLYRETLSELEGVKWRA